MSDDPLDYARLVEAAMRGVVRAALAEVAANGLPGAHHFYLSFDTTAPGVVMPDHLRARFPVEMTIVLQHEFWGLEVGEDAFSVTLSFQGAGERLTIPFAALNGFVDPDVKFGLQFQTPAPTAEGGTPAAPPAAESGGAKGAADGSAEVVPLDAFRKKT